MHSVERNILPSLSEKLPRKYSVKFEEFVDKSYPMIRVSINDVQYGDIVDDNSYENDGYRYHDIFHYTFAALLDWSPCVRSMLKLKRKSSPEIDRIEDGARAAITEEAISLMIFNDAKFNNFYEGEGKVSDSILEIIKRMTLNFEVSTKSKEDWQHAILKSYEMFRLLKKNRGGIISFNSDLKTVNYKALN